MYHTDSPAHGRRPGRLQRWLLVLAAAAACNAMIGPAAGQEPERGVAVLDRPRPDYDPIGIRAGAFLVFPSIEPGLRYDGNIFRVKDDKTSDRIISLRPEVRAVSQWSNHELVLGAGAASDQYFTYTDESKLDWFTTVAGRVDFTRATKLHAALDLYDLQEEPDDPASATAGAPGDHTRWGARTGASHRLNRLAASLDGAYVGYAYDEAENEHQDRHELELSARVDYQLFPQYEAFARVTRYQREYERRERRFKRDSGGWELVAGADLDLGGLVVAEVFAGYRAQEYQDALLPSIEVPTLGLSAHWNVTPLTTVTAQLGREITETTHRASGNLITHAGLGVDHELLRNLILGVRAGLANHDYAVIRRERPLEEDILSVELGGTWLADRHTSVEVSYRFEKKGSTVSADQYDAGVVSVSLRLNM